MFLNISGEYLTSLAVTDSSRYFSNADKVITLASGVQYPFGMCLNPRDGCLYVCNTSNDSIRKISMKGDVGTFIAKNNLLKNPKGIVMNYKENCFFVVSSGAHTILKITFSGAVSIFAGGDKLPGNSDGVGTKATFNSPISIAIDQQSGNLFVGDQLNYIIRQISPKGEVSTLAGSVAGFADGTGKSAKFGNIFAICFDGISRSLLVSDNCNSKLRRVGLNGEVTTVCDIPSPTAVTVTSSQSILVTSHNHKLYNVVYGERKYEAVVLAGTGTAGKLDGRAGECSFNNPLGIAVHEPSNTCFISDFSSHSIRKVSFATPVCVSFLCDSTTE